jgi:CheY-like chemotaxis protein
MDNTLPIYQHPTLTVLIDDSQSFLESLAFRLGSQFANKSFCEPQTALGWLKREHLYSIHLANDAVLVSYDEKTGSFERRNASIDVAQIYYVVMNRERFAIPSVLVIDYEMPQMNGVEFCQTIKELPCRKILLTGEADEKIAVEAFNRNLIDCFINKSDPDALDKLEAEITKLQRCFFNRQSQTLKDILSRHSYSFLSDPVIGELVQELCTQNHFVEYYLFPNPDGILFVDTQGKATLMVIETRASLKAHLEIAQDQDAPPEMLDALKEMQLVPFFSKTGGVYLKEIDQNWVSFCLPSNVLKGEQDYFWALFDLPANYLHSPLYSYREFLKEREI